jgi:hypothetical protein
MSAMASRPDPASAGAFASGPRRSALGAKLVLAAALAATLSLGAERPLPMLCLLLEALYVALGSLSLAIALVRRERPRPGVYGHWHEAAVLGLAALASHLALGALR